MRPPESAGSLALALAEAGVSVIISARNVEDLWEVKRVCGIASEVDLLPLDPSELDSLPARVDEALRLAQGYAAPSRQAPLEALPR